MDNLRNLKQWLDKLNKNIIKKIKAKFYIFETYFSAIVGYGRGKLSRTTKETAGCNLYYIDYKPKTLISALLETVWHLTPPTITEKKRNKEEEMFLIDHDMHQKLCELVNTE